MDIKEMSQGFKVDARLEWSEPYLGRFQHGEQQFILHFNGKQIPIDRIAYEKLKVEFNKLQEDFAKKRDEVEKSITA